jgi:hypothetical protein
MLIILSRILFFTGASILISAGMSLKQLSAEEVFEITESEEQDCPGEEFCTVNDIVTGKPACYPDPVKNLCVSSVLQPCRKQIGCEKCGCRIRKNGMSNQPHDPTEPVPAGEFDCGCIRAFKPKPN